MRIIFRIATKSWDRHSYKQGDSCELDMSMYRDVGVSGATLGISCGEDGVNKHESADDFSTKAITLGVTRTDGVGPAARSLVEALVESLHHTRTADGPQALHYHVEQSSR